MMHFLARLSQKAFANIVLCLAFCWSRAAFAAEPERIALDVKDGSFWIIVGIILLLGGLFWYLFAWQQRVERNSFFLDNYRQTIRKSQLQSLVEPLHAKWDQGIYIREIFQQLSPRGTRWLKAHPRPVAAPELEANASKYDLDESLD